MPQSAGCRLRLRPRRELAQVPVTALGFCVARSGAVFVLAGEDGRLGVYSACATGTPLGHVDVFRDQPVHGVRVLQGDTRPGGVGHGRVLVWGGSSVAVLDAGGLESGETPGLRVLATGSAPDRIYDGAVSPWEPSCAVLATAHCEVVPLTYDAPSGAVVFGAVTSPSRPMLYAAHLTWTSPTCVLVAGGTVFGDVVVWKYRVAHDGAPATHDTLFVLSGHEGSVYGVDMSPAVPLADGSTMRLLASCSDDRTIRIWDITERGTDQSSAPSLATVTATGFNPTSTPTPPGDNGALLPSQDAVRSVAVAMGHASRIWGVKFDPAEPEATQGGTIYVYSFGEDATAQRWHLSLDAGVGGRTPAGRLMHGDTFALHSGRHLWAGALLRRAGKTMVATGGGDGGVSLVEEPAMAPQHLQTRSGLGVEGPCNGSVTVDVQGILKSLSDIPDAANGGREIIGRYDFLLDDRILVTTTSGRLFLGSLGDGLVWEEIQVGDGMAADLKLTYVLRAVGNGAAVLGATNGSVLFFRCPGRLSRIAQVPGRVVEISCLSAPRRDAESEDSVDVLIHLLGNTDSQYMVLDSLTGSVLSHEHISGLDTRFVAVSAARMDDLVVMGSRRGWLCLLTRQDNVWRPVLDLAGRSREAITAIVPLPSKKDPSLPLPYFLATSRDGKYRIYHMERQDESLGVHLLHETSPPFGPMIEGAWFTQGATPQLILYGFRSTDFVIWNETRREEVATVECGGAHRTFRLVYSVSDSGRFRFAFTRTSKLSVYSQAQSTHRLLRAGGHGREIRALCSNGRYLASGAEDTSIRLWEHDQGRGQGEGQMRHLACVKAHVTGIQCLRWLGHDYLFSSGGHEEFFVWRVRRLDTAYSGLAVMREAVWGDKSAIGDLRIVDFDVGRWETVKGILVTLAFSNSTMKTYRYSPDSGFEPFAQGWYTGACLTQARLLGICRGKLWTLTASTDGHMALWETQTDEGGARRHWLRQAARVHQSSIKGLDMVAKGGGYRVVTGGDDNGLGVAVIAGATDGDGFTFAARGMVRKAHAAAINGVVVVGGDGDDDVMAASVSNDQRLRVWKLAGDDAQRLELVGSVYSGVADPGDVAAHMDTGRVVVAVGGVGVEVWSWD